MVWEHKKITLDCGCQVNIPWSDDLVGTSAQCSKHGEQWVEKASRIYEAKPSRNFQLGVKDDDNRTD